MTLQGEIMRDNQSDTSNFFPTTTTTTTTIKEMDNHMHPERDVPPNEHNVRLYQLNDNFDLVDSLPYVDGYSDELKDELGTLIAAEIEKLPRKDYLAALRTPKTPLLDAIFEVDSTDPSQSQFEFLWQRTMGILRVKTLNRQQSHDETTKPSNPQIQYTHRMNNIVVDETTNQYPLIQQPSDVEANDIGAWKSALTKAKAQAEHMRVQELNLELALKFAQSTWSKHLLDLEAHEKRLKRQRGDLLETAEQLNKRRKLVQVASGNNFRILGREYDDCMQRNLQILKTLIEMQS